MKIEIADIKRLDVKSGDVLVIRVPVKGDHMEIIREMKSIRKIMKEVLPDGVEFVVAQDDVDFEVIRKTSDTKNMFGVGVK